MWSRLRHIFNLNLLNSIYSVINSINWYGYYNYKIFINYLILCIEIKVHEVTQQDELIIMASDGIWEFLDN